MTLLCVLTFKCKDLSERQIVVNSESTSKPVLDSTDLQRRVVLSYILK